jgi:hypothetical protein
MKNISDLYLANPPLDSTALTNALTDQLDSLKGAMGILDALNSNVSGLQSLITT